jgi:large subunit ribosomal protein L6
MGKKPIQVPSGVKVHIDPKVRRIEVEGPKGKLDYAYRPEVDVRWDESESAIVCTISEARLGDSQHRAYWGTVRSRIENLVIGVSNGYAKKLEVVGVGWNAQVQGQTLRLNIGYCHPVDLNPPGGVEFKVEGQMITVSGADKQAVGQFAAEIRSKRKPEPYNGKGIKYTDEIVSRKQGKVFGS